MEVRFDRSGCRIVIAGWLATPKLRRRIVEKRQQERRQQDRREQDRREQDRRQQGTRSDPPTPFELPPVLLPGGFADRDVVIESVAELVTEIRAAAPGIRLERAEAIAIGIRRDVAGDRANIRK